MTSDMAKKFEDRKAAREASGKKQTPFFVGVRQRGMLNTIMSEPARAYEEKNPERRTKWEYAPASGPPGSDVLLVQRKAQGFTEVLNSEVGDGKAPGAVRVGDMVLLSAPADLVEELELEDAMLAHEDAKLPETTYKENVRNVKVKLRDGTVQEGRPVGTIRRHEEVRDLTPSAVDQGEETQKGGE